MADGLKEKSPKIQDKNKYSNVIQRTTSETIRIGEPDININIINPSTVQNTAPRKKTSSFQVTSVIISRMATDGDDSADDLDESHTEDSSDVIDISRVTDNETPSYSEDTCSREENYLNGNCVTTQTLSSISLPASVSTVTSSFAATVSMSESAISVTATTESPKPVTVTRSDRFKVVKLAATEPYRRGRWLCLDYFDQPTTVSSNMSSNRLPTSSVHRHSHSSTPNVTYNNPVTPIAPRPIYQQQSSPIMSTYPSTPVSYSVQQPHSYAPLPTQVPNYVVPIQGQTYAYAPIPQQQYSVQQQSLTQQPITSFQQQQPIQQQNLLQHSYDQQHITQQSTLQQHTVMQQPIQQQYSAIQQQQQYAYNQQTQNYSVQQQQQPMQYPTQVQAQNQPVQYQTSTPTFGASMPSSPAAAVTYYPQQQQTYAPQQQTQQVNSNASIATMQQQQPVQQSVQQPVQKQQSPAEEKSAAAQESHNEESTDGPTGNAVAIDNKIEQAMDLVKSHLMFAVREEVEVLKERIAELTVRINQLEVENNFLKANATQETLAQLPQQYTSSANQQTM